MCNVQEEEEKKRRIHEKGSAKALREKEMMRAKRGQAEERKSHSAGGPMPTRRGK